MTLSKLSFPMLIFISHIDFNVNQTAFLKANPKTQVFPPATPLIHGRSSINANTRINWKSDKKFKMLPLAAPGFWFGEGESRGNGSEGANAGGPGGEGPPDGSEVSFFQTMQSIRKWIHFSKIEHFSCQKIHFFKGKIPKADIFTRIPEFFEKIWNGYHAPPRRGSGGEGPPDDSEVSFFKTIQNIRKWIHFSK